MNTTLSTTVRPQMIESREVAEMLEMRHADLILKLEGSQRQDGSVKQIGIIPVLTERKIPLSDYFIPSTYKMLAGKKTNAISLQKWDANLLLTNLQVKKAFSLRLSM